MNAGHAEALARTRMQQRQAKPVNTRPLDENGLLFGALERSADAAARPQTYADPRPQRGEREFGPKSNYPKMALPYRDDQDLAEKLWDHLITGKGQPVIIDLTRLDFSRNLNAHKLFSVADRKAMLSLNKLSQPVGKMLIEKLTGKRLEPGFPASNEKLTFLMFQDPITNVTPKID